ncbi:unnamed protein product [Polarella glacialis]|uniref:Amine oxidase n=1 Tax=Polarella glacialis TaxID=89957 RepID=A0A813JRQ2_POLGL|nr:unnamed protein product [Polarella glacialis]
MRRPEVSEVISGFAAQLRTLAAEQQSRYSLTVSFPRPLRGLAFDAASVHGSPEIQFLCREASRGGQGSRDDAESWVVQSTSDFARELDSMQNGTTNQAAELLYEATKALLQKACPTEELPEPLVLRANRWESGFFKQPLDLNRTADGGVSHHNDAVSFEPWRLALCGDYLGNRQSVELAALSGMMAANRVAEWAYRGL